MALGHIASGYIRELSRRRSARQQAEIEGLYALCQRHEICALLGAMEQAMTQGAYGVEYLTALLEPGDPIQPGPVPLIRPDLPGQEQIDRPLCVYEAHVTTGKGGA